MAKCLKVKKWRHPIYFYYPPFLVFKKIPRQGILIVSFLFSSFLGIPSVRKTKYRKDSRSLEKSFLRYPLVSVVPPLHKPSHVYVSMKHPPASRIHELEDEGGNAEAQRGEVMLRLEAHRQRRRATLEPHCSDAGDAYERLASLPVSKRTVRHG